MSVQNYNLAPVRLEDRRTSYVGDNVFDIAPGCVGCVVFDERHLTSTLLQNDAVAGLIQEKNKDFVEYGHKASMEDRVFFLAKQRGYAGITGACTFIDDVENCWRRGPVVSHDLDYEMGLDYAHDSNRFREEYLKYTRLSETEAAAAERLKSKAAEASIERKRDEIMGRALTFEEEASKHQAAAMFNLNIFEALGNAAADLLGRPEQPSGQQG